jgi:hypothetical protein
MASSASLLARKQSLASMAAEHSSQAALRLSRGGTHTHIETHRQSERLREGVCL